MTNTYKIAERNIAVTSLHDEVHRLCANYFFPDSAPDFTVETTQTDIDFEREKSAREDELEGIPIRQFSDGYLETLAVYRKIAEQMPDYDTILFHGSCVAVDGVGERLHMHIEPGLMHCYASAPVFRESRRDFGKQIALLKKPEIL